jgi:hypothetical protein
MDERVGLRGDKASLIENEHGLLIRLELPGEGLQEDLLARHGRLASHKS